MSETLWVAEWTGPVIRSTYEGRPCFIGTLLWVCKGFTFDVVPHELLERARARKLSVAELSAMSKEPHRVRTQGIVMDPPRRDGAGAIIVGGLRPGWGGGHRRFTPMELPAVME